MGTRTWDEIDRRVDRGADIDLGEIDKYTRAHLFARAAHRAGGLPTDLLTVSRSTSDLHAWVDDRTAGHAEVDAGFGFDIGGVRAGDVALRAVRPDDYGPLYEIATDPRHAHRWRFRGQLISFDHFVETFDDHVLVQLIAVDVRSGRPLSLNVLYGWEPASQVCSFGYIGMDGGPDRSFERTLGIALTFSYAFSRWPIRTIYGEIPGFNRNVIDGLPPDLAVEEGRLRDYFFFDGRWWDKVIVAIHREPWTTYIESLRVDRDTVPAGDPPGGHPPDTP